MATDKQIAANRANGARSRGPKTPEGKARAARNSTRHGLLARAVLREGESRDRFDELVHLLNSALNPCNAIDELLIGKMAAAHWRQMRAWTLEREGEKTIGDYEMRLDRQFGRNFDRYVKLKKLSGETNPINLTLSTTSEIPGPNSEPKLTHSGPKLTQSEPKRLQSEPDSTERVNQSRDCEGAVTKCSGPAHDLPKPDPSKGNN